MERPFITRRTVQRGADTQNPREGAWREVLAVQHRVAMRHRHFRFRPDVDTGGDAVIQHRFAEVPAVGGLRFPEAGQHELAGRMMTRAFAGTVTCPLRPTAEILLPLTTTTESGTGVPPLPSISVAPSTTRVAAGGVCADTTDRATRPNNEQAASFVTCASANAESYPNKT